MENSISIKEGINFSLSSSFCLLHIFSIEEVRHQRIDKETDEKYLLAILNSLKNDCKY